jgi:hypothetical protein
LTINRWRTAPPSRVGFFRATSTQGADAADLEQLKAERLDLGKYTEKSRLVGQLAGEHRLAIPLRCIEAREAGEQSLSKVSPDADFALQGVCRFVHGANIALERMSGRPPDGMNRRR